MPEATPSPSDRPSPDAAPASGFRVSRRIRFWILAGIGISLATMVFMLVLFRLRSDVGLGEALTALDPWFLAAALGLHVLAHLAWSTRQWALARGMGWRLGYGTSFRIITAGVFGAAVTPARVGGDGLRLALLQAESDESGNAAQVVLADRVLDLLYFLALGLMSALAVPVFFGKEALWVQSLAFVAVAFFAALLVLVVALVSSRSFVRTLLRPGAAVLVRIAPGRGPAWVRRGDVFLDEVRAGLLCLMREQRGWVGLGFLFTMLTWLFEFSILYVLLWGFGHEVAFLPVIVAAVLLNVIMSLPLTPGGSGVAEIAALALYSALAPGVTPVFVLVWRAVTYYYDLSVGGVVTIRRAAGWLSSGDQTDRPSGP